MSAGRIRELLANHSILICIVADEQPPEQPAATGSGPMLQWRYFIDVARARRLPVLLMRKVQTHLSDFSFGLLADFERKDGPESLLKVGDEFHIKILGPWNGAVRVTDAGAIPFEFVTLEGHPEAAASGGHAFANVVVETDRHDGAGRVQQQRNE